MIHPTDDIIEAVGIIRFPLLHGFHHHGYSWHYDEAGSYANEDETEGDGDPGQRRERDQEGQGGRRPDEKEGQREEGQPGEKGGLHAVSLTEIGGGGRDDGVGESRDGHGQAGELSAGMKDGLQMLGQGEVLDGWEARERRTTSQIRSVASLPHESVAHDRIMLYMEELPLTHHKGPGHGVANKSENTDKHRTLRHDYLPTTPGTYTLSINQR